MRGGSITVAIARADTLARTLERCSIKIQSSVYKTPWLRARRNTGLMPYAGIRKGPLPGRASVDPNSPLNGGDYTRSVGISQERTRNISRPSAVRRPRQNRHRPQVRPELLSMAPRKHPDPAWRISPRTLQLVPARCPMEALSGRRSPLASVGPERAVCLTCLSIFRTHPVPKG